ncbi:MAG: hypothetical protein RQ847_09505 [Wenzhouxiangellaceae bacterium]|nr:hypothetical protein [Wenzhouxiangellaceae bacterium]
MTAVERRNAALNGPWNQVADGTDERILFEIGIFRYTTPPEPEILD